MICYTAEGRFLVNCHCYDGGDVTERTFNCISQVSGWGSVNRTTQSSDSFHSASSSLVDSREATVSVLMQISSLTNCRHLLYCNSLTHESSSMFIRFRLPLIVSF